MKDSDHPEDEMIFAQEPDEARAGRPARAGWKVMIIDDDAGVHEVTRLALSGFEFDGRDLESLHAYSAAEGEVLLRAHPDTAPACRSDPRHRRDLPYTRPEPFRAGRAGAVGGTAVS